jgi:glucan endo-1,3-alpha-glucosidase
LVSIKAYIDCLSQLYLLVQDWQGTCHHSKPLYCDLVLWLTSSMCTKTDHVIFWYRAHPKSATCSGGHAVRNSQYPADAIFAYAMLASPATVELDIGLNNHVQWDAPAGVSIGSVPFPQQDHQIPYIQIVRSGSVVKAGYGSVYVDQACSYYNFNPFVGIL